MDAPAAGQRWSAADYARNGRFVAELGAPLIDWLRPQPGERVLDLGCGPGSLWPYWSALPDVSTVATRGGLATTVGMISDGDCRWERVMFPLELDHIMTIGELAMVWPKPLFRAASAVQWSSHQQRCPHIAIQPKLAFPVLCMVSAEWGP